MMRTTPSALLGLSSLAVLGCGPSTGEPTLAEPALYDVLAERCGSTDPIQLLALAPNETIEGVYARYLPSPSSVEMGRYGDRWLLVVLAFDRDLTQTSLYDTSEDGPQIVSSRVVSVDACGGDTRVVAEDASSVRAPTDDEPWSACSRDLTLIVFDPDVEHSGQAYPELSCTSHVVDDAFVTRTTESSGEERLLVRARLQLDGSAELTPLTTAFTPPQKVGGTDRFLVEDYDGNLVEADARTGQSSVLRTGVSSFDVSNDGRFLVWSSSESYPEPEPWFLWDRQTDEERPLGLPEWSQSWLEVGIAGNMVAAKLLGDEASVTQLTLLPSLDERVLEGSWSGRAQLGETYVLRNRSPEGVSSRAILEPGSEVPRPIPHGTLHEDWVYDERLWILGSDDTQNPPSYSLLELAAPAFEPTVVATDIWYPMRLTDGRLLTVLDRDAGDRYGTLVLVDSDGPVTEIDSDVLSTSTNMVPLLDDEVAYTVRDADHERTGVWLAQIAALPER